jgi:hypothetical protein
MQSYINTFNLAIESQKLIVEAFEKGGIAVTVKNEPLVVVYEMDPTHVGELFNIKVAGKPDLVIGMTQAESIDNNYSYISTGADRFPSKIVSGNLKDVLEQIVPAMGKN